MDRTRHPRPTLVAGREGGAEQRAAAHDPLDAKFEKTWQAAEKAAAVLDQIGKAEPAPAADEAPVAEQEAVAEEALAAPVAEEASTEPVEWEAWEAAAEQLRLTLEEEHQMLDSKIAQR